MTEMTEEMTEEMTVLNVIIYDIIAKTNDVCHNPWKCLPLEGVAAIHVVAGPTLPGQV